MVSELRSLIMSRREGKEVEGVGSGQSSARDDEVESLRIKLQRLERSLQEKEDTIEELRGDNIIHVIGVMKMNGRMIHHLIQEK